MSEESLPHVNSQVTFEWGSGDGWRPSAKFLIRFNRVDIVMIEYECVAIVGR